MYVYVDEYSCVYTKVLLCMGDVCTDMHIRVCVYIYVCIDMCVDIYRCIYIHLQILCERMCCNVYIYMHIWVHALARLINTLYIVANLYKEASMEIKRQILH